MDPNLGIIANSSKSKQMELYKKHWTLTKSFLNSILNSKLSNYSLIECQMLFQVTTEPFTSLPTTPKQLEKNFSEIIHKSFQKYRNKSTIFLSVMKTQSRSHVKRYQNEFISLGGKIKTFIPNDKSGFWKEREHKRAHNESA